MGIVRYRTWQEDGPAAVRLQGSPNIKEVVVDAGQHYQDVFSLKGTMPPHPTHCGPMPKKACCSSCASGGSCEGSSPACPPTVTRICVPETVTCTQQREMICQPAPQPMCLPPQPIWPAPQPMMCPAPQPVCPPPQPLCVPVQAPAPMCAPAPVPVCTPAPMCTPAPVCQPVCASIPMKEDKGIKDHFIMNILSTLFCCLCFGAIGIMNSLEVQDATKRGDLAHADNASQKAKRWCYIATGVGIIFYMIALILALLFLTGTLKFPVTWATG